MFHKFTQRGQEIRFIFATLLLTKTGRVNSNHKIGLQSIQLQVGKSNFNLNRVIFDIVTISPKLNCAIRKLMEFIRFETYFLKYDLDKWPHASYETCLFSVFLLGFLCQVCASIKSLSKPTQSHLLLPFGLFGCVWACCVCRPPFTVSCAPKNVYLLIYLFG